jgi:hypothetical protein
LLLAVNALFGAPAEERHPAQGAGDPAAVGQDVAL